MIYKSVLFFYLSDNVTKQGQDSVLERCFYGRKEYVSIS